MKVNIYYNTPIKNKENAIALGFKDKDAKAEIPKRSKDLPLLLARLAYVFEIYDKDLKDDDIFEDFVLDKLNTLKIKKNLAAHDTTLEEVAGVLYLIDRADEVEIFYENLDSEEEENLISFLRMIKSKVKNDIELDFNF